MSRLRARYGAHPLHLLAMLASFALAGYAAVRLLPANPAETVAWFVGAAVGHDLLLLPLYAIADTALVRVWRRHRDRASALPRAPWLNHVRMPAALSALLLLVFAPLILRLPSDYTAITGLSPAVYLERWLLVTAALFGLSALGYAVRLRRVTR